MFVQIIYSSIILSYKISAHCAIVSLTYSFALLLLKKMLTLRSCLVLLLTVSCATADEEQAAPSRGKCDGKLLVIGVDGFRYDYMDKVKPTALHWLASGGVTAKNGLTASFVTKTLPNFWSIATGTYQDTNGIIDNG